MKTITKTIRVTFVSVFSLVAIAACDNNKPPAKSANSNTNSGTVGASSSATPPRDDQPQRGSVSISDSIIKACSLKADSAHFAFDSSLVQADDDGRLDKVAKCFSVGPLTGKTLKLIGHADPRGDADYNQVLGQQRADSISMYVQNHGLAKSQVTSTSRGAIDAVGTDEVSWAKDRRVNLDL